MRAVDGRCHGSEIDGGHGRAGWECYEVKGGVERMTHKFGSGAQYSLSLRCMRAVLITLGESEY